MVDEEPSWQPTRFHVHLGALVRRSDEILIMKRAVGSVSGAWYWPGGGLEEDESPEDGIRREIREEAGLEVNNLRLFRIWHTRQPDGTPALALSYTCDVPPGTEPVLNFEHSEHRWIAAREYREQYFSDEVVAMVAGNPSLRTLVEGIRETLDAYLAEFG
ncbi:MAG: NUDIX domain-containing protein [Dehalococcoidia bacterium]